MRRPIILTSLIALFATVCWRPVLVAQDANSFPMPGFSPASFPGPDLALASFQRPSISPAAIQAPSFVTAFADDPGGALLPEPGEGFADAEAIPAPLGHPGTASSLIDQMPVPYSHPGAHLWAGRCQGCQTLAPCPCPPAWASVDVLWLKRGGVDGEVLAIDQNLEEVLRTDDFDFNYESGVRVIYGEVIHCIPLELTYFGTHDWNSSISFEDDDMIVPFGPANGGAFEDADIVDVNYASELHSIELNVLRVRGCNMTWMGGVRYIDAEEDFLLRIFDNDPNDLDGLLAITSDNRLLGVQFGADAQYNCNGWSVGLEGKAGVYVNFAERDLLLRDNEVDPELTVRAEDNSTELAFVGEAMFGATRHLGCGLRLRGGYQVMWVQGLALAAEQLGNTAAVPDFAPPSVDADGSILYDGGYVGLEWHR